MYVDESLLKIPSVTNKTTKPFKRPAPMKASINGVKIAETYSTNLSPKIFLFVKVQRPEVEEELEELLELAEELEELLELLEELEELELLEELEEDPLSEILPAVVTVRVAPA